VVEKAECFALVNRLAGKIVSEMIYNVSNEKKKPLLSSTELLTTTSVSQTYMYMQVRDCSRAFTGDFNPPPAGGICRCMRRCKGSLTNKGIPHCRHLLITSPLTQPGVNLAIQHLTAGTWPDDVMTSWCIEVTVIRSQNVKWQLTVLTMNMNCS